MTIPFETIARLAASGDNVAIASQQIDGGSKLSHDGGSYRVDSTILEGHRFACEPIDQGAALLSWGMPFGHAIRDIRPGDYVCNAKMLHSLAQRRLPFSLPGEGNFKDYYRAYELDETSFSPGQQVARMDTAIGFEGYSRGRRGVGTRNVIVVLGTSSLTGSYARMLAGRLRSKVVCCSHIDEIAVIAHTEGGEGRPNNLEFTLRALAGFVVHPNVGAVLAVDIGGEAVNNAMLRDFLERHDYPLGGDVGPLYAFMSIGGDPSLESSLQRGETVIGGWIDEVNAARRTLQPSSALKLALQCGGSDAFSGISGNPLAGWLARRVVELGGSANLAETDELIGAESYVLSNVRDLVTAKRFLEKIERFKQRAAWHGHGAEGNPTGGNHFRGLYNICLKSIGAARKKDPAVRLDDVIDYAQPMNAPGFYFMDSPGNDLESVAGQVASGANMILFTTGNGSITNFPFVPTLKIVTTSRRYQLISNEMDINAGRYQDGESMDDLGGDSFQRLLKVASGQSTAGEEAGHSQVQLWRDWRQTGRTSPEVILSRPKPTGRPLAARVDSAPIAGRFMAFANAGRFAADRVAAVVPTSLCAGQVAKIMVDRLNGRRDATAGVSRFVTFVHTEGCGVSSGDSESIYLRTLIGHMTHPMVRRGLFLEHGCEKTHNDAMREALERHGGEATSFGWASIQLDGGIERATSKVEQWFDDALRDDAGAREAVAAEHLRVAVTSFGPVPDHAAGALAELVSALVASSARVVVPMNASLLAGDEAGVFGRHLGLPQAVVPTLVFGGTPTSPGLHVMETPTAHATETLTGLGATGVDVMVAHVAQRPLQCHPMIPVIQVASAETVGDMDLQFDDPGMDPAVLGDRLVKAVLDVASGRSTPQLSGRSYDDFQVTRGLLGVSL